MFAKFPPLQAWWAFQILFSNDNDLLIFLRYLTDNNLGCNCRDNPDVRLKQDCFWKRCD